MARIERKVRDLVSSDSGMREALELVLDRSEDGEIRWVDVRDDLTSGQWGRLIEKGILVDGEEGFAIEDPEAVRAGLEEPSDDGDGDDEGSSWSQYDKGAAVVTVGLFAGYSWAPMRNLIGNAMHTALGPLAEQMPFYAVVMVLALATGLYSTLLQANLMNMDKMSMYQERMQDLQERRKEAKENDDQEALDAIQEEQMEAMGDQMGMFKEQFRPMVWIMFLTIPVFLWMYWAVGIGGAEQVIDLEPIVLPLVGERQWRDPVAGPMQAWIVWYFLCSMGFTQVIRKGLNIDMTPSTS